MAGKDKELEAISSIIDLLKPLNSVARSRVLEYVLKRLEMEAVGASAAPEPMSKSQATVSPIADIRALTAEKQPRSVNEMVALVAYYVSELSARRRGIANGQCRHGSQVF
jgi:hypothetical protein